MVEALWYKPARDSSPHEVIDFFFSIYLILPTAIGPGVHSASNRNKYYNIQVRQANLLFLI
jgi:hypothetical protein